MKIKPLALVATGLLSLSGLAQAGPQFNIIVNPGFNNCAPRQAYCPPRPVYCAPRPAYCAPVAYYNPVPAYYSPVWVNTNPRPRIWPSAGVNRVPDPVFVTQPVVTTTTFRWRR